MHESGSMDAKISEMAGHNPGRLLPRAWAENRVRWAARSAQALVWAGERDSPSLHRRLLFKASQRSSRSGYGKEANFKPPRLTATVSRALASAESRRPPSLCQEQKANSA